jgi:chromosome segregation ATPase
MSADKPINFPPIEAITFLADAAKEELLEFTEAIKTGNKAKEIEDNFWDFLASCQAMDEAMTDDRGTNSEPDWYSIVEAIEKTAIEMEQKLELQTDRSRSANRLIIQQTAELNEAQTKLSHLIVQLETTNAVRQRQQEIIDRLTDSLQQASTRIASIERDCSALQEKYQQQTDRLWQTEAQVKELSYRLERQQRYTLQFKTALNECLEEPVSDLFQAQPIPTWSKQIYQSLQARESSVELSPRQHPSFVLAVSMLDREPRSMSDVSLPRFFH